jgi:hypothetical protein
MAVNILVMSDELQFVGQAATTFGSAVLLTDIIEDQDVS